MLSRTQSGERTSTWAMAFFLRRTESSSFEMTIPRDPRPEGMPCMIRAPCSRTFIVICSMSSFFRSLTSVTGSASCRLSWTPHLRNPDLKELTDCETVKNVRSSFDVAELRRDSSRLCSFRNRAGLLPLTGDKGSKRVFSCSSTLNKRDS